MLGYKIYKMCLVNLIFKYVLSYWEIIFSLFTKIQGNCAKTSEAIENLKVNKECGYMVSH